ncbi:Rrf2 family transcriptional regulator [Sulfurovum sp. XGS-02]|uniref:RrF2 family transcriptional regulator n=1 Tax=Sulfurovum sp. XGS-02 TaxID=2925411 RepID=UPI00205C1B44|nr:Rrf2 family transcriptional regulator [Sulfurovum sp. XGS-02]UPT78377.1 Rrf2 family transcriptional regulator [Sulfurovum sp. XGS-02]
MIGISSKTIYAIAALQELGSIPDDKVLKIKEIAANAAIPQNFLEQILLELKKQGLLTSIKGAHGGYKLAKSLKDITLKDVVLILESDIFADNYQTESQALKLFWDDIKQKVSSVFEIPLSELKNYQLKANQILNYSI